ncbi:unnamed protein product [Owenia fusiformis]|uniref:Uncharacterized protein n=1 Tax=Owenia fusiformis TaxID=6347 RepID=A0A8S4NZ98_OWEFU|nr:unnamed protein product [Owenia fusiformis]
MENSKLEEQILKIFVSPEMAKIFQGIMKPLFDEQAKLHSMEISSLQKTVSEQKSTIRDLDERIDQLEQNVKLNTFTVRGLKPTKSEEENKQILLKLLNKIDVEMHSSEITNAYPIGNDLLLVKTSSRAAKQKVFCNKSKLKGLKRDPNDPIVYFNEDLTKRRALLFKRMRDLKKAGKIKGTFTRNGEIVVITNTKDAKPKEIKNLEDLARLGVTTNSDQQDNK